MHVSEDIIPGITNRGLGWVAGATLRLLAVTCVRQRRRVMRVRMMLAFVVMAAATLAAQTFRGTILGTVTGPSGAVVSGARVRAKTVATGRIRLSQSSPEDSYSIHKVPIGTYT